MLFRFWKSIVWLIIVSVMSLLPGDDIPSNILIIPHMDKIIHFGMYFILISFLIHPLLTIQRINGYLVAFLLSLTIGGLLEILQQMVAINRSGSYLDFLANITGSLAGIISYKLFVTGKKIEIIFKA